MIPPRPKLLTEADLAAIRRGTILACEALLAVYVIGLFVFAWVALP